MSSFYDLTISTEIELEPKWLAETGLLRITLLDDFDNPISISSVHLILLRDGTSQIAGYGDLLERKILWESEGVILETTNSDYSLFLGSIEYDLFSPIDLQLVVESKGLNIPETQYLSSIRLTLEP